MLNSKVLDSKKRKSKKKQKKQEELILNSRKKKKAYNMHLVNNLTLQKFSF